MPMLPKKLAVRVITALALVYVAACAPSSSGDGADACLDDQPEAASCCDALTYEPVALSTLLIDAGRFIGRRVEVTGVADWYGERQSEPDCACAGTVCGCVMPLGLRSPKCGDSIPLAGQYRGRQVQCDATGCFPLTVLGRFAVCGTWVPSIETGIYATPALSLEAFCSR